MRSMKIGIFSLLFVLFFTTAASAGKYFRAEVGLSDNSHTVDQLGTELDIDSDDPGIVFNGALGYKPNTRSVNGFFGEIEVGYSKSDGDFEFTEAVIEGPGDTYTIESEMHFVTLFVNVGHDFVIKSVKIKDRPVVLAFFAGAGPVFSGLHAEVSVPGSESFNLDHTDGDTALGWQVGGRVLVPILSNVDLTASLKRVDFGDHKTVPGYEYDNQAIQGGVGITLHYN